MFRSRIRFCGYVAAVFNRHALNNKAWRLETAATLASSRTLLIPNPHAREPISMPLPTAPRADPYVMNYLIRLLP